MNKTLRNLLWTISAACSATTVFAADWASGGYLTGDWGGRRQELAEKGVEPFGYYNAIIATNVSGGLRSGKGAAGDLYTGVNVDLGRLLGWDGWHFTLSGIDRHGNSIDRDVGSIYSVMQLVGGQTYFLYNLALEKTWSDDTYALKFGRITATDDFAGSPFYSYYLSNSIDGQIRAVLFDGVMTSYPFPVWGARFQYAPSDDVRVKLGVYQLTDRMFDPDGHGVDFSVRGSDGISLMTQIEWDWAWDGRPGHLGVGLNSVWFDMPDFNAPTTTDSFIRYYLQLDQQVSAESRDPDQGLYLFGTLAYTRQEAAALVPFQISFGAQYVGPLEQRARDRLIFGTTYGKLSGDYADEQVAQGNARPDYEWIFELGYRVQLTDFAYVQPDIQYVSQPGGSGDIPNATVVGAQLGVTF
jgi:porin